MLQNYYRISIVCPVSHDADSLSILQDIAQLRADEQIDDIFRVIEDHGPLGRIGTYENAMEIYPNLEIFTPTSQSRPTQGNAEQQESVSSVTIVTYAHENIGPQHLNDLIQALSDAHPWEHPIIEVIHSAYVYDP